MNCWITISNNQYPMETLCTITEMRDGTREIKPSREDFIQSFFIREQFYVRVTEEKLLMIINAKKEDVQTILKTL